MVTFSRRIVAAAGTLLLLLAASACGRSRQARVDVPPPPVISAPEPTKPEMTGNHSHDKAAGSARPSTAKNSPNPPVEGKDSSEGIGSADLPEPSIPEGAAVVSTENGLASWYGPPYHNRRGSNGEVYNMHAMTAAHKTLPLGTIVRVTNLKTGHSAVVRITDRGPFIPGRVIDLSLAAAQRIDVWQAGVAPVKLEIIRAAAPMDIGGRWAVQIGGFPDEDAAATVADVLTRRYRTAKVLRFVSPAGDWWIRVRVLGDDRQRAQQLVSETTTPEGAVFLVRLD